MADPYSDDELSLMDSADGSGMGGGSSPRGVRASPSELASLAGSEGRPSISSSSAALAGRGVGSGVGGVGAGAMRGSGVGMGMGGPRMAPGSFRAFILSAALAELVATFLLVFITLTALYSSNMVGDDALQTGSLLMVALSYGLTYGCLVYALSLNGGGYVPSVRQMNPAVTLALYLLGKIDAVKALIIVAAQVNKQNKQTNTSTRRASQAEGRPSGGEGNCGRSGFPLQPKLQRPPRGLWLSPNAFAPTLMTPVPDLTHFPFLCE